MNVINHFVPLGYAVYGLDHIGHGKSERAREFGQRYDDFTDTLTIFYTMMAGWQGDIPIFILAEDGKITLPFVLLQDQQIAWLTPLVPRCFTIKPVL